MTREYIYLCNLLLNIELYINEMKRGICKPSARPVILKQSEATAWVDGRYALGATVGNFCMDLAIKKAKESGVGWVSAKGNTVSYALSLRRL